MKFESFARRDALHVELQFANDPLARGADAVVAFVDTFAKHGMAPTAFEGKGKRKPYKPEYVREAVANPKRSITFYVSRDDAPEMSASIQLRASSALQLGCYLELDIAMSHFSNASGDEHTKQLVDLVRDLCTNNNPLYGLADSKGDFELVDEALRTAVFTADRRVNEMYWLLVLGSDLVDQLGRERVMSTPAKQLEALPNGSVLIVTSESPAALSRQAEAAALAHLRPDISIADSLKRYAERDQQLAPVERDWDPDLADVLELICDEVPFSRRQQQIARFNGYRSPAVSEVTDQIAPSDVPDVAGTVARYDVFAEQLVALLHDKVKRVSESSPDILPELDLHFWRYNYPNNAPRSQIDSKLVPAVGAYLGDLLVRHLDGTWVPRAKLDESLVVVGGRAWLVFLRARHYLESQQAVLDYSLTKFFREAQRQARHARGV